MWELLGEEGLEGGLKCLAFGGKPGSLGGVADGGGQQLTGGAGAAGVHELGQLGEPVEVGGLEAQGDFAVGQFTLVASGVLFLQRVADE